MYHSWLNVKIKMYNFKSQRLLFNAKFDISKIGKNKIFLCKIEILNTKYPKKFRASLRSTQFV